VPHQLVGSELGGAAAAPDGSVWFTARGAGIWRLAGGELRRVLSDDARLLSFSPDGVLWVADAAAGVRRYAVAGDGATSLPVVARPERCQGAIAGFAHRAGRDGVETWLATAHGLLWFRDGRTRCYDREAGLPTAYVTAVAVDERSQVWAGSSDGWVARVGDERIVALSESTGLPCDAVRGLIADQRGGLWIACDGGVARLPLEDADAFAAGARRDVRAIGWNRQTGMRSEETSATTGPVVATDDEGALWVATIGGLTRVANPAVQPLPAPPRARITRLLLDGVDGLQGATVRAASAGVELSLAALTAIGRRPAWFHRTLSSVDGGLKWDDFDPNPEVRYDSIPAGSYVFEATARDAFGVWDAHVARATFQIKRPLHRMPAVWATFFALAIAAGLFAHRLRVHTMRRQFDAIAAERERIARDLHDGLGQGFTALRFRLEAARRRRSHEPVLSADDVVESLESLVNAVEEESRRAIWNLRARALGGDDVAKGLARLHDEFARSGMLRDARLTVSSSGPCDDVDAMVAAELLQVAREALTNAVRHAKPSEVHVSFDVDDEVRLCVYDDGVGFAYAPSELVAGGHYGILGMRERLRRLGGVLVIDSAFGQGTTVLATVPRRRKGRG
jgi:signal transduction histidine kinase